MHNLDLSQVLMQGCNQAIRQHGDAVLHAFGVAHQDFMLIEVDVFDAQLNALGDAHTGSVKQLRH